MTAARLRWMVVVFVLTIAGVMSITAMAGTSKPAQPRLPETYAVSNYGDILDFEALARSSPQVDEAVTAAHFLPPAIPSATRIDATASAVTPGSAIDSADRVKVNNTTQFPWSTIVHIQGKFGTNTFNCTGWMLGVSTVATAAHCLYDYGRTNLFATEVIVVPAQNTSSANSEPFGRCAGGTSWIVNHWQESGNPAYDYGVLTLKCRIGEQTGSLGFSLTTRGISGTLVNLTGYPFDKGGTMWFDLGYITDVLTYQFFYSNATEAARSGAPVWLPNVRLCYFCVVAIHTSGRPDLNANIGVRITDSMFNLLAVFRNWQYARAAYQ